MKKSLLSLVAIIAMAGYVNAQTTYLDFEGKVPAHGTFGGSDFSVVDNPSKTGVNTTNKVAMTQKGGSGIEDWGGVSFPIGGTINFAAGAQTFTMDVFSAVAGSAVLKTEQGAQPAKEVNVAYTTPGQWQTLTFDFADRNPDVKQLVVFMGFGNKNTDVWYYDNLKGPGFTVGAVVDVTVNLTDLGGTVTTAGIELSNNPGVKVPLTGTPGVGAKFTTTFTGVTGSTISAPITYTIYVDGVAVPAYTDQAFTMAGSAPSKIEKNYGTAPVGLELINNGGFDGIEGLMPGSTGREWGMWSGNGSVINVVDGVVNASPTPSNDNWQLQLEQKNYVIENGKVYSASFDAWANDDRIIALTMEDPANGYALLGTTLDADGTLETVDGLLHSKWNIPITTVKTRYTRTLTANRVKANTEFKFAFLLAQAADMVFIDNVSLKEIANVSVSVNRANAVSFYPNPAQNDLYFSGKSMLSKVVIYNIVGAQVREFRNVSQSINVSDLKSGVYMIKSTDENGKTSTSKFLKK
jgi:hypothetical protein